MARARNIKPSFFTNEQLADNDPIGRLLFIGLWTLADYNGNLEWKERTIKIQILPWDNCDIRALAINLDKSGLIRFYSNQNKVYINITNFTKHQNPHINEKKNGSLLPMFSNESRQAIDFNTLKINPEYSGSVRDQNQSNPADSPFLIPDSPFLIPDSLIPETSAKPIKKEILFEGVSDQVIKDFTLHRKNKKAAITQTAINGIKREATKAGISLEAALIECCERGWTGFKADWYNKSPPHQQEKPRKFNASEYLQGYGDGYGNPIKRKENDIIDIN